MDKGQQKNQSHQTILTLDLIGNFFLPFTPMIKKGLRSVKEGLMSNHTLSRDVEGLG